MGKASTRAQNRYIAKAHDRINLTVPKGKKDIIQARAEAQGQSVNGFINAAIDEKMEKPPTSPVEAPTMHDGAGGWFSLLPPEPSKPPRRPQRPLAKMYRSSSIELCPHRHNGTRWPCIWGLGPATGGKPEKEA